MLWVTGERSTVQPPHRHQTLRALATSSLLQMRYYDGAVLGSLAGLLRGVPRFELDVDDSPTELRARPGCGGGVWLRCVSRSCR